MTAQRSDVESVVVAGRPLLEPPLYSALVVVVIVTTLVTPPALKWAFARGAPSDMG